jgi:hypothetical protein
MLMGLMINGVPLVTARFILGAKMAMAGVLIDGVKAFGEKFGQQSADFIANEQANQLEFVRYSNNYRHGIENIQKFSDMAFLDPKNSKHKGVLDKRMQEFMDQAGHMHKQGDALDALAKDLGTKGMIALSAAAATGMISVPALAFGSERYLNSVSGALGGSKTFHRMAHSMKAQLYEDNFKLQYYQFARGAAADQLVALQGASSKRGEYWNHPTFSQDSVKNLYMNPELARQQEMQTKFQIMGDILGKQKRR